MQCYRGQGAVLSFTLPAYLRLHHVVPLLSHAQGKVEDVQHLFLTLHHVDHGLDGYQCACPPHASTAMEHIRARGGPLVACETMQEGQHRVRIIRDTKVRPTSVVELLHLTNSVMLRRIDKYQMTAHVNPHLCQVIIRQFTIT